MKTNTYNLNAKSGITRLLFNKKLTGKTSLGNILLAMAILFASVSAFGQVDGNYCPGLGQPGDEYADALTLIPQAAGSGTCAIEQIWADIDFNDESFKLAFKIGNSGTALFRIYIDSDNNPSTGLTTENNFGGTPFAVGGAEFILQIRSNNGLTKLYETTGPSSYVQVPLNSLAGANGDFNGCSGSDGTFLEFYIPFGEIGYDPCATNNPGEINIAQYASVSGGSTSSSFCLGSTLDFGVELSGSVDEDQTLCPGVIPDNLILTVTGTNSIVQYWEVSTNGTNYTEIASTSGILTYNPGALSAGTYYYRAQVQNTDVCTNNFASSAAIITVISDNTPPVFDGPLPGNLNLECGATIPTAPTLTATDNCDTNVDVTFDESTSPSCGNTQTITRTWTASDGTNSTIHVQTINIVDNTPPSITAPATATVECTEDSSPAATGTATGSDSCGGVAFTFSDATVDGCGNTQTITRTWTATDDCGNTATADQTINIVDNTPPSITAPATATVECTEDSSPAATGTATGSDSCGGVAFTFSDATVDGCGNTQTITRTWTATDDCGNTATADQTINIVDNTPPSITAPATATVECTEDSSPAATGTATGSDSCGGVAFTFSDATVDGCGNTQTITRTWTATDDCGNTATADQTINIVDNTPPSITAPATATVECTEDSSPAATGTATGSDSCGGVAFTFSDATVDGCGNTQTITRTWTATDDCGNTATADQTINIVDNTPPSITAPATATVECTEDSSPAATGTATGSDSCGGVAFTFSDATVDGCGNTQTITRTWTATDDCGNTATADQTINIVDNTPPSITAPATATVECTEDSSPAATGTATGSDSCGGVAFTFSDATVDGCGNTQTITRTWTATDDCGNTATADQTINIVDNTPPSITAPATATVECTEDSSPAATGTATGSDSCGGVAFTFSDATVDGCGNTQTITRTWTATDDCGNTATADQTINIVDNTPPSITAPATATVECTEDSSPAATGTATGSDSCGGVAFTFSDATVDGCGNTQTITRTWTATDDCGNTATADQTINIVDNTPPSITAPATATVECTEDSSPAATGTATGSDSCGGVAFTFSDATVDGCGNTQTITRTWTATDDCGNTATADQTINIVDNTPPSITAPATATVECTEDSSPAATGTATGSDSCGGVAFTFSDATVDGCGNTQTITRTWTATDDCGNTATADQTINIVDNTPPSITAPATATVECTEDSSPAATGTATGSDSCGGVAFTFSDATVDGCGNTQTITRTWTATDDCGNTATADQTINIVDNTPPSITAPATATVECTEDSSPAATGTATGSDSCGGVAFTFSDATVDGCGNTQTITRTWTATDDCGNTATADQTINIVDNTPPSITAPATATVECTEDSSPAATGTATGSDSCGGVAFTFSDATVDGCGNTQTITRTWTATDDCGNTATADQTINIVDNTPPSITAPATATVECTEDSSPAATGTATGSDSCGGVAFTFSDATVDGCGNTQTITRTWTATDDCGNTATADQTINIVDNTPPSITAPATATVECTEDSSPAATGTATGSDSCGGVAFTFSDATVDGCGNTQTITRTWTATDDCGNTATADQTINIVDNTPPSIDNTNKTDIEIECGIDDPNDLTIWLSNNAGATATDTCGEITWSNDYGQDTNVKCDNGAITVTFTAEDACGNKSTTTATYLIKDTENPDITTVASDQTVQCDGAGNLSELNAWLTSNAGAEATDNCSTIAWSNNYAVDGNNMSDECGMTGSVIVIFRATDACGNYSETTAKFSIEDTQVPVFDQILPQDITVECDAVPTAEILTASDVCSNSLVELEEVFTGQDDACANQYTITRTWTATDECGLTTSHIQVVTVIDSTNPEFDQATLPESATVECDAVPTAPAIETITATDTCGNTEDLVVTFNEVITGQDDVCANVYTVERTWTVSDCAGNSSSYTQTITVIDSTNPEFDQASLPESATVECDAVPTAPAIESITATDTCGNTEDLVITFNEVITGQDDACANVYTVERTWTVSDCAGNSSSYTQTITVIDSTNPEFDQATLPESATVECDAVPTAPAIETITATDTCGNTEDLVITFNEVITGQDDACANVYTVERTWTVSDCAGNSSSYTQTITVIDSTNPEFDQASLPESATVECDAVPTAPAIESITATDTCGNTEDLVITFNEVITGQDDACANVYTVERTWTVSDCAGNSSSYTQTITVIDSTNPEFDQATLPESATVECDAVPTAPAIETITATDTCGNTEDLVITFNEVITGQDDACANEYTIERTWTVSDCAGNSSSYTQTITVIDSTNPEFDQASLPESATVECDAVPNAPAIESITATDTCGNTEDLVVTFNEVITGQDDACANVYTVERTWTVSDCAGNSSSYTQTITVIDSTNPEFDQATLPESATVECDAVPTAPAIESITATDTCGNTEDLVITFNEVITGQDDACANVYTVERTWTVSDCAGNSSSYTQTITVIDSTNPEFDQATLPESATVECDAVPTAPAIETITATDTCGNTEDLVITFNEVITGQDDACANVYTIERTWTVSDCAGNSSSYTQTITVIDSTNPEFDQASIPESATVECDAVPTAPAIESITATDTCGNTEDLVVTFNEVITGQDDACANEYTIERTWTVSDCAGNSSSYTQTISVIDSTNPEFDQASLPESATVECDAVPTAPAIETITATDTCGNTEDLVVTFNEVITGQDDACANVYTLERTWTVTDCAGNSSSYTQTINVVDTTSPVPVTTIPTEISVSCSDIPDAVSPGFTDNCSESVSVTFTETFMYNTNVSADYDIIRKWTAVDECGNERVVEQKLVVKAVETIVTQTDSKCYDDGVIDLDDYIANTNDDVSWTFVSGVSTPSLDGSIFNPSNLADLLGDYTFSYTFTTETGCLETTEVTLTLDSSCIVLPCSAEDVIISKAVTPNGDQYNPSFDIYGIEACGFVANVKIFNRWGALIFKSDNYTLGEAQGNWKGQVHKSSVGSANTVPNGTYYYIVILENSGLEPFTGPLYLGTK